MSSVSVKNFLLTALNPNYHNSYGFISDHENVFLVGENIHTNFNMTAIALDW